jgi:excisionase family DNA binding protein
MDQLNEQLAGLLVAAASFRLSVADELGILVTDLAAVLRLRQGETTTGELSAWLGFAPGSTTPVVDRLSSAGLIDRTRDQVDKRRIVIRLTDAGVAMSDRADAQLAAVARDLLRHQDRDILTAAVDTIVTSLTAATPGAVDPRPTDARPAAGGANSPTSHNEPLSDLLVTSEVAKLFHVSRETIHYWCRTGRLPSYRTAGGHRRFDSQVIRNILAEMDPAQANGAVGLPPKLAAVPPVSDDVAAVDPTAGETDLYASGSDGGSPAATGSTTGTTMFANGATMKAATSDLDELDNMAQALDIRTVIGQAEGILMERYNLTVAQALSALQRDSVTNDRHVQESADHVIARNRSHTPGDNDFDSQPTQERADEPASS